MLLALTSAFGMSQAYRTVAAILAPPLQVDFGLSASQLGVFAGAFHFAFGGMQLFIGVGIDLYGVRRTLLAAFPLAIAGSALSALAGNFSQLLLGQVLIGLGCAPAFLVCTIFIARHFPPAGYAGYSGLVMAIGGGGLLFTGTPMAWMVEASSWRIAFWVLAFGSALAWLVVQAQVHEERLAGTPATPTRTEGAPHPPRESPWAALRGFGALLKLPHTWGIVLFAAVGYASFLTLRGLWLGPMLIARHGFSIVESGHVAFVVSLVSLAGPPLFGRLDPGRPARRLWLIGFSLLYAALFALLAWGGSGLVDVGLIIVIGLISGYLVLQYSEVRDAYPAHLTGRAMSLFTMAMFLGIGFMQWITGLAAGAALAAGLDAYRVVPLVIMAMLAGGTLAFGWIPRRSSTA